MNLQQSGVNVGLLQGPIDPTKVQYPEQVQPDFQGFFKARNEAEDRKRKMAKEDEELQMKRKEFETKIEEQKYLNRLRDAQTQAIQPELTLKSQALDLKGKELKNDINKNITEELKEVREYQDSISKIAAQTKDPKARKKLTEMYNKNPLVVKYGMNASEDVYGNVSYKTPSIAEREISKEGAKFIAENTGNSRDSVNALANIDQSINLIETMPEKPDTGYFAGVKKQIGSLMESLGMNNSVVDSANDLNTLSKSLKATTLSLLRPLLGSQFTEREGQVVQQTFGQIDYPRKVLVDTLKLMKSQNQQRIESNGIQNALVQQNPDNLGISPNILNKIQDFPKAVYKIREGKPELITYYDFAEYYKRKVKPDASYVEIREAWADEWKDTTNSDKYIGTKNLSKNILDFLKSSGDVNIGKGE